MDGHSVSLPPDRATVERFARWILENGISVAWTFSRGTKAADKTRLDTRVPTELGAATGYIARRLQDANLVLPGAASSLFLVDGDTPEIVANARRIGGETFEFTTGRGRTNLVYRAPEGAELHALRWKDTEERLEAVADGYLVAPLSVHPDTGELYVQTNDLAANIGCGDLPGASSSSFLCLRSVVFATGAVVGSSACRIVLPVNADPDFLTPDELASELGLTSSTTILRRIRVGDLRAEKVGRGYRIARLDAERLKRRVASKRSSPSFRPSSAERRAAIRERFAPVAGLRGSDS